MHIISISFLPVFIGAVVMYVVGVLWYSPLILGHVWRRFSLMNGEILPQGREKKILLGLGFIGSMIMSYVLAVLIMNSVLLSLSQALAIGFWMWLGFVVPTLLWRYLWTKPRASIPVCLIDAAYLLVALLFGSAVLFFIL